MTKGVLVLPPRKTESLPLIKELAGTSKIVSNVKIPIANEQKIIKVPNTTDIESLYFQFLNEMIHQVDEIIIVSPTKIPILFALVASQEVNIRVIVKDKIISTRELLTAIDQSDKVLLEEQWNRITSKIKSKQITTPNGATLRPYQQQMVDFAIKNKRVGLFVDMGLGKTLATLATIDKLNKENKLDITKPVLVIAPITVALDTWAREADKWGYDMDVLINVQLTPKKKKELFAELLVPRKKLTILTTNPAQMKSMIEHYHSHGIYNPFQFVVVDELSQFKSAQTKRFEQVQQLTKKAEYFLGLTGTPAPNNLLDIWSQLMVIDSKKGSLLGYNFFTYRSRYFEPDIVGKDGTVYRWKLQQGAEQSIYEKMKSNVISLKSEGLLELPDIVYDNRYVKLPKKAQKVYDKVNKELRQKLLNEEDAILETENNNIEIANSAVLANKLTQLTSGAIYDNILDVDDTEVTRHYDILHDEKMKALKDIVETSTSPILVFFWYKSELERMSKYIDFEYLDPHRKDFTDIVSRWNNGDIPVLVAHPASAGHGLNLQEGGHTIVWMTPINSNEQYRQANKRIYRSGQTHTVSIIHLLVANSEDEVVMKRLSTKEEGQDRLMTALNVNQKKLKIF